MIQFDWRKRYNYLSMRVVRYDYQTGVRRSRRVQYLSAAAIFIMLPIASMVLRQQDSQPSQLESAATQMMQQPASTTPVNAPKITNPLPWPDYGQAAYGVVKDGVLAESNAQSSEPVPVASLAKVITALAILEKKPLDPGEQGPTIILTDADIKLYEEYVRKSGSVVQIQLGEQITEYQALQAMLLPSANNIADTMALRTFGTMEAYNKYATKMLKDRGIDDTVIDGASGYSPNTKSTAADMVKIGILYMQNPVLREIAAQPSARLPFAGIVGNYNNGINGDGVVGIKIGFTEEAGNTFLVADMQGGDKDNVSVVAILGADSLEKAMQDARKLLKTGNNEHKLLAKP